jgi:beta-lactamase class A
VRLRSSFGTAAALAGFLSFAADVPGSGPPEIQKRLEGAVREFPGTLGVAVKNLDTGESFAVNGDTRFPTASLIKVAVMAEVEHRIAEGTLSRETTVTLKESDKAGDEPVVLNQLHGGIPLTVSDLLALMIAFSDNTATNLLVGLVGAADVDRRMVSYGLANTKIFRPTFRDGHADVFPEEEREFGLGMTTPREIARLMELIAEGKVVSRKACDEMLSMMEKQQDRAMIPRSLPFDRDRITVANKTGWDEEKLPDARGFKGDIRTDAAYVKSPKARYVIAICTRRVRDKSPGADNKALVMGAAISRMIYDHFNKDVAPAGSPSVASPPPPLSAPIAEGESVEAAVVVTADNEQDGIAFENEWIYRHYGRFRRRSGGVASLAGRRYDVIKVELSDHTERTLYFDITDFFGREKPGK